MEHIFVVDDNPDKIDHICSVMELLYPEANIYRFDCAIDFINTVSLHVDRHTSDGCLFIIDMQMPWSPHSMVQVDSGYRILKRLAVKNCFGCPAIVVSSDTVDDDECLRLYNHYAGSVLYSSWRPQKMYYEELLKDYFMKYPE